MFDRSSLFIETVLETAPVEYRRKDQTRRSGFLAYPVIDVLPFAAGRYNIVVAKESEVPGNFGLAFAEIRSQVAHGSLLGCQ